MQWYIPERRDFSVMALLHSFGNGGGFLSQKPPLSALLDMNHPLARGLVGCCLCDTLSPYSFDKLNYCTYTNNGINYLDSAILEQEGIYLPPMQYIEFAQMPPILSTPSKPFTIIVRVKRTPFSGSLVLGTYNESETAAGFQFGYGSTLATVFLNNVAYNTTAATPDINACPIMTYAISWNPSPVSLRIYGNGKLLGAFGGAIAYTAPTGSGERATFLGVNQWDINTGSETFGDEHYQMISAYDRVLSITEIKSLHENPYQMIQQKPRIGAYSPRSLSPAKSAWRWA